jgi:outer membrane protein assembly factor BamD (BamD/ComL family)
MSIAAISTNSYFDYSAQSTFQQIQQQFQQLGSDLQAGNLTAAQSDFVTLQHDLPQASSSASQSNSPIEQAFNQLAQDLQAGNITAAQQDYQTIQQDLQNQAAQWAQSAGGAQGAEGHHHHQHGGSNNSQISQLMTQLGQELQSGSLSSAQQTFSSLQQIFQQHGLNSGQAAQNSSASATSTFSVNA